jgi:hypothetical protein
VADDGRSKTPGRWAPFERGETLNRRKESLGTPVSGFFGSLKGKGEKGTKKGDASSNIRWKQTWEVQKLKRARASTLY